MGDSSPPPDNNGLCTGGLEVEKDDLLASPMTPLSPTTTQFACEMCQNYETSLTILQDSERKLKDELKAAKALSDRYESELLSEREYRRQLEKKMTEVSVQFEDQLSDAIKREEELEKSIQTLMDRLQNISAKSKGEVENLRKVCESLETQLTTVNGKYANLLGTKKARASELRDEAIDMPEDKESLQLHCLQLKEQLIECTAAKEHLHTELTDECAMLRVQIQEDRLSKESTERELTEQINTLNTELGIANSQLSASSVAAADEMKRRITELQQTVGELEDQVQQVQDQRKAVEQTAQNYKERCSALQTELNTCETVQKDFVKLSQSLQIQLEKIRQSEQEVRWQFDEDVDSCGHCGSGLVRNKAKPHCRHCGKIFCAKCLQQTIQAGPSRRPANVCQVCHTLLNRDSAPFFSVEK